MDQKLMWVTPYVTGFPDNITWEDENGHPSFWCRSEQERAALLDLTCAVLNAESVVGCLPPSETVDDFSPASADNLPVLRSTLEKPGALGPADERAVVFFEDDEDDASPGRGTIYGLAVSGMSKEAFECLCRYFHACVFNFKGRDRGWSKLHGNASQTAAPDGSIARLSIVQNDIRVETNDVSVVLVNGLPGYTVNFRVTALSTGNEQNVRDARIGTRAQVSAQVIAECLSAGEEMQYHWIEPVLGLGRAVAAELRRGCGVPVPSSASRNLSADELPAGT
ncbi:MAG: hypothetical protein V2B18_04625 [Pseudomonadota bacterium]